MPTIIDSLFLELGIDTSKFSKDQQAALAKIAEFERRSKKGAKGASQAVKTVGEAFRDIADDSRIGTGAHRLDTLATKLKGLGQAAQVSGGAGTPLGKMAEGLGALLSPAALGIAAVGLLGKGMWDLNEKMTATNATIFRQAQLSGMNAKNLWAWGEAARTVGAQPQDITGGISSLQTAVTGMGIGAGNATGQLVALARLGGIGWNFQSGVNIPQLFERVHELAKARGYRNLGALRALTAPLMNGAMWALATDPAFNPDKLQGYIKGLAPPSFGKVLRGSLESQKLLGKKDIMEAVLAERAYGGIQNPMQALVGLMTNLLAAVNTMLGWTIKIADWIAKIAEHFGIKPVGDLAGRLATAMMGAPVGAMIGGVSVRGRLPSDFDAKQAMAMRALMGRGMSRNEAAALIGNASQESSLNPFATNDHGAHIGLFQLDKSRQKQFAKAFGYAIGSKAVSARQQFLDQVVFAQMELASSQSAAARKMAAAHDLYGKTRAFEKYDERPGDHSFGRRLVFAQEAYENAASVARMQAAYSRRHGVINRNVTHHTRIGEVNVHTQATDANGMAKGARHALTTHPLLGPVEQHQVTLSTSAVAG